VQLFYGLRNKGEAKPVGRVTVWQQTQHSGFAAAVAVLHNHLQQQQLPSQIRKFKRSHFDLTLLVWF